MKVSLVFVMAHKFNLFLITSLLLSFNLSVMGQTSGLKNLLSDDDVEGKAQLALLLKKAKSKPVTISTKAEGWLRIGELTKFKRGDCEISMAYYVEKEDARTEADLLVAYIAVGPSDAIKNENFTAYYYDRGERFENEADHKRFLAGKKIIDPKFVYMDECKGAVMWKGNFLMKLVTPKSVSAADVDAFFNKVLDLAI